MDPLPLRLKELDPNTFQQLCFHLMVEKYPSGDLRYVEGAAGDEGLDIFRGELSGRPTIWQCKSFHVTRIGDSQKNQIRQSLRDAVVNFSPRLWVLCLNLDLDSKAHRWLQKLQTSYSAKGVQVELVQGSDIVHELMFRHTLRGHYFPDALLLDEVRRLIPRSTVLNEQELEMNPGEDIEQYIERLRARDPRFIYEVTIGGDRGPSAFPPPAEPGLVAAITDGRKTIKAYARDGTALSLDPVGFSITLAKGGIDKMLTLIRKGQAQHFDPEEIRDFKATLPLLSGLGLVPGESGLSIDLAPTSEPVPVRVSFVGDNERVVYELLDIHVVRAGTEELEVSTMDEDLPFQMRFVFPTRITPAAKCGITIKKQFAGKDVIVARKAAGAFRLLGSGCDVEMYSLRHAKTLALLRMPPVKFDVPPEGISWIDKLGCISEKFGTSIRLPEPQSITQQDYEAVKMLYALATGGSLALDNVSMGLVKSAANSELMPNILRQPASLTIVHESASFKLLGTKIEVGRFAMRLEKAEFKDPDLILLDFQKAKIGEAVRLSIRPLEPAKVFLLADEGGLLSDTQCRQVGAAGEASQKKT